MSRLPVLVLYGIDEKSHDFEVASTRKLIADVTGALTQRGWVAAAVEVTHDLAASLAPFRPAEWVVLNLCEGAPGQAFYYATAAKLLEDRGYVYTGSAWRVLDETQFKWQMKRDFEKHAVPTPRWELFNSADQATFDVYPAIVKPAAEHCSYGITRNSVVLDDDDLRRQVRWVVEEFKAPALVEEFLDSPEYNVSLWGNGQVDVLNVSTMTYDAFPDVRDRLCTFEAKWDPDSAAYQLIPAICPAPISGELWRAIEDVSIRAYVASGCRDYGRVDLRLARDGRPLVLDVNANCDVSPDGGFANAARAAGMSYGEMLERLVMLAVARAEAAPDVRVRPSVPEDRASISHILLNSGIFGQTDADVVDEMFVSTYAKPITRDSYHFLTCEVDGRPAGFACYGTESLTKDTWDLFWVCALPEARRRGVGRALLSAAVEGATRQDGRLMVIYTSSAPAYHAARRLYEAHGFGRAAVIPDYYADGDDLCIYARRLNDPRNDPGPPGGADEKGS